MLLSLAEVTLVRARINTARAVAAARYREIFTPDLPPTAHLEIHANALLEEADGVRATAPMRYELRGNLIEPPPFATFVVERKPLAIFEYWLVISEILASPAWAMTRVIATPEEYNDALRRIDGVQIVRALHGALLPDVDLRDDGTAMLEVTVYTRAAEERIERRTLFLDGGNEFHFHGRELIAEGRGGVTI